MTTFAGTAARPTVSVVVCAFTEDRWEDLSRAISSVHAQTEAARETILVIDYCPGLLRRARRELAGVIVVPNRFEKGLSGGRNTGVAEARGDVVAFMDDDAAADPDWIARLAARYQDPRVVGVGGLVTPVWDTGRPSWFPPELDWVVGCSYRGMATGTEPVRNFIGANMSFRRDIVEDVRGFSTGLGRMGTVPLGCEETELCLRISQRYPEGVLLYEPAAAVSHTVRRQRASWGYLRSRCFAEGLSKAQVARLAGAQRALASERSYVRSTIPRGVGRSLAAAARGRLAGMATALALVTAVVVTSVGYVVGRIAVSRGDGRTAPRTSWASRVVRPALIPWGGLAVCLALWTAGLREVHVARVATAGLGLITVMPVTFWAALGVLMVSFCYAVTRRATRWPVLGAHLLALVAILHATPVILYGTLRYSWAWKHVGVTDFITHHGIDFKLGGILGAYQGWPGFFAINSFLTSGSGLTSPLGYASWALPVNALLWLGPVILIARAFTSDQRLVWTAAWLFELGNWVGQDYFSPQAFAYFLYLTVIAVCLRWLWPPRRRAPSGVADTASPATGSSVRASSPDGRSRQSRSTRFALVACLVPMMAAIASSHQLTPLMLIAALTILAVFRHLRPRVLLPALTVVITVGWLAYGARAWLTANRSQVLNGLGLPWANASAHLVGQGQIPFDQVLIDRGARSLSAAVAILAVIGYWRYRHYHDARARSSWFRVPLLAAAAIAAAAGNSYGGEILFRVYLFALPFMAIAAAAAFFPHPEVGRSVTAGLVLVVTVLALVTGFSLANYGDESQDYFTPREVDASVWLYQTAPKGAQVLGATSNFPWAFVHYSWYDYTFLDAIPPAQRRAVLRTPVKTMVNMMEPGQSPASYLILTKSQAAEINMTGIWPAGAYSRFTHDLLASGNFRVVYRNADATILQLAYCGTGRGEPRCHR